MPVLTANQISRVERALMALNNLRRNPGEALGLNSARMEALNTYVSANRPSAWNTGVQTALTAVLANSEFYNRLGHEQRMTLAKLVVELATRGNDSALEELRELGYDPLSEPAPATAEEEEEEE